MILIAGPCHLDSDSPWVAERLGEIARQRGLDLIFKGSFDKANRTRHTSPRGPGLYEGLRLLGQIAAGGIKVTTDIHEVWQIARVGPEVHAVQIPAFLSRQTDLIRAAAETGLPVHIKKGQFMSAQDAIAAGEKAEAFGAGAVRIIERGTCFGYGLVNDFAALARIQHAGFETVYDVTHSLQKSDGYNRPVAVALTRAALAVGVKGLFIETHPEPARSGSDQDCMVPLGDLPDFLDAVGFPML